MKALFQAKEGLAENGMPSADILTTTLAKITRETARANAIVEQVRQYARSRTVRRARTDPKALFDAALRVFGHSEVAKRVSLRVEEAWAVGGAEIPTVRVDPLEIELALTNLLKNAAEAATLPRGVPEVSVRAEARGQAVIFTIEDNGPALSDDAFARLSVPLTSAKPEGLGLGLGIARSIAEVHGGTLVFTRRASSGVRASLTIPVMDDAEPEARPEEKTLNEETT